MLEFLNSSNQGDAFPFTFFHKIVGSLDTIAVLSKLTKNNKDSILTQQDIFKFPMVLEEETQQKLEISSERTTRKGKFPFHASEILGNCAFPLSFHRENSNEILIFFAVLPLANNVCIPFKHHGLIR